MQVCAFALGVIALGSFSGCSGSAPADAPKTKTVRYEQAAAVTRMTLTPAGSVADTFGGLVAIAPDGRRWALVTPSTLRLFDGDHETRAVRMPNSCTSLRFSADGKTLYLDAHHIDASTGAMIPVNGPGDLAPWAKQAGLPAPDSLWIRASATSADGKLIVGGARDGTFSRNGPMMPKPGIDRGWLVALDGTWKPIAVMWHGQDWTSDAQIAIGDRFVAAGDTGSMRIFARDALTRQLGTSTFMGTIGVAWAPGDALLAAVGGGRHVEVWRAGSWAAPAATWEVGGDYQTAVVFHPTRPALAVTNADGHVRIYGVAEAQLTHPPLLLDTDVGGDINGIAFSPDGAGLWVSTGPSVGKVFRFTVTTTP